jgi:hypothetical protein
MQGAPSVSRADALKTNIAREKAADVVQKNE